MKNLSLLLLLLIVVLFIVDANQDKLIEQKNTEIRYLKQKVEYLKFENYPVNMIIIGKNSLHCVSSLGGGQFDPWIKYHVKELKHGKNYFDFVLNDSTRVELGIERN